MADDETPFAAAISIHAIDDEQAGVPTSGFDAPRPAPGATGSPGIGPFPAPSAASAAAGPKPRSGIRRDNLSCMIDHLLLTADSSSSLPDPFAACSRTSTGSGVRTGRMLGGTGSAPPSFTNSTGTRPSSGSGPSSSSASVPAALMSWKSGEFGSPLLSLRSVQLSKPVDLSDSPFASKSSQELPLDGAP